MALFLVERVYIDLGLVLDLGWQAHMLEQIVIDTPFLVPFKRIK